MAQGDVTLFDWAPQRYLTKRAGLLLNLFAITTEKIAKYTDREPAWTDYDKITSIPTKQIPNVRTTRDGAVTSVLANSVLFDPIPDGLLADKLGQMLIGYQYSAPIGFIDLTDDGGVTPWDLQKVPLRITFGEDGLLFNATVE